MHCVRCKYDLKQDLRGKLVPTAGNTLIIIITTSSSLHSAARQVFLAPDCVGTHVLQAGRFLGTCCTSHIFSYRLGVVDLHNPFLISVRSFLLEQGGPCTRVRHQKRQDSAGGVRRGTCQGINLSLSGFWFKAVRWTFTIRCGYLLGSSFLLRQWGRRHHRQRDSAHSSTRTGVV